MQACREKYARLDEHAANRSHAFAEPLVQGQDALYLCCGRCSAVHRGIIGSIFLLSVGLVITTRSPSSGDHGEGAAVTAAYARPQLVRCLGVPSGSPASVHLRGRLGWCNTGAPAHRRTGRPFVATLAVQEPIRNLMAKHDPILLFASNLLQPDIARDAGALYAWCRRLDEIVDGPGSANLSSTRARLDEWKARLDELSAGNPRDDMDAALLKTFQRHPSLNVQPFYDMLEGMRSDAVDARRIATSDELDKYAYQVAGTVGLMLLPLLGVPEEDMEQVQGPAVALGQAIQLINILRDARPDVARGRIYLPLDEMKELGVAEADVISLKSTPAYRSLVERTAYRAEVFLTLAQNGALKLPGAGPVLVYIIIELYRDYLTELRKRDFDNLSVNGDRVSISTPRKVYASMRAFSKLQGNRQTIAEAMSVDDEAAQILGLFDEKEVQELYNKKF